jgi:hypothetical protein
MSLLAIYSHFCDIIKFGIAVEVCVFGNHESYLPVKGKAIPLQAWTGPEGSRSLRLPDFKTIGT